ncbi:putative DUF2946 domain-containing protein [Azospirillaceae bacterium]
MAFKPRRGFLLKVINNYAALVWVVAALFSVQSLQARMPLTHQFSKVAQSDTVIQICTADGLKEISIPSEQLQTRKEENKRHCVLCWGVASYGFMLPAPAYEDVSIQGRDVVCPAIVEIFPPSLFLTQLRSRAPPLVA